ncbi:MAG: phospho-sugar mutase [Alicyclobacillus sp.]|nr:phospho-sugar mutase [Alicyclobacillus sp.]
METEQRMARAQKAYEAWRRQPALPDELRAELERIAGAEADILDRFDGELAFGTGGLRGVMGAGTNRMNLFTVRRASAGLAHYWRASGTGDLRAVVGYDCRHHSREFALEAARVFAAHGIRSYVFPSLCPTPELSFAVRSLQAVGGVMITASHNPPAYNGYKVYNADGCQILPNEAEAVTAAIADIPSGFDLPLVGLDDGIRSGAILFVPDDVRTAYVDTVVTRLSVSTVRADDRRALRIVYTPLHGTGNVPVRRALEQAGYHQVQVVREQEAPDGSFPTVASPNPEEPEALSLAIRQASAVEADLVMGTDPDADRVGVAVRMGDGSYRLLTGNQVGGLLVDFVLRERQSRGVLPGNGVVLKTIVTSELGAASARQLGVKVVDTLTGFKYIGDQIGQFERSGEHTFLFGYEESYGYLAADFVRDKDAVQTCLLIAEMAAWHKRAGRTLVDALADLYERVGYFAEALVSATLPGAAGQAAIASLMADLRENGIGVPEMPVAWVEDYHTRERTDVGLDGRVKQRQALFLPQADVLKFGFVDGSWLAVRPSGTEPKIKFYVGAKGTSEAACAAAVERLRAAVDEILKPWTANR